jgi:hypothetical protein
MGRATGVKSIIAVMEAAARLGAARLKYGDLELDFKLPDSKPIINTVSTDPEHEVSEDDEANVKQLQLDELLVTDPQEYEKLILGEGVSSLGT